MDKILKIVYNIKPNKKKNIQNKLYVCVYVHYDALFPTLLQGSEMMFQPESDQISPTELKVREQKKTRESHVFTWTFCTLPRMIKNIPVQNVENDLSTLADVYRRHPLTSLTQGRGWRSKQPRLIWWAWGVGGWVWLLPCYRWKKVTPLIILLKNTAKSAWVRITRSYGSYSFPSSPPPHCLVFFFLYFSSSPLHCFVFFFYVFFYFFSPLLYFHGDWKSGGVW